MSRNSVEGRYIGKVRGKHYRRLSVNTEALLQIIRLGEAMKAAGKVSSLEKAVVDMDKLLKGNNDKLPQHLHIWRMDRMLADYCMLWEMFKDGYHYAYGDNGVYVKFLDSDATDGMLHYMLENKVTR